MYQTQLYCQSKSKGFRSYTYFTEKHTRHSVCGAPPITCKFLGMSFLPEVRQGRALESCMRKVNSECLSSASGLRPNEQTIIIRLSGPSPAGFETRLK